jgi:hypothetical protein
MKNPRKIGDIWNAINDQRLEIKMGICEWKQSYIGVKAAIEYIGLELITTKEELDAMEVPVDKNRGKNYLYRNIIVSRNGIISKAWILHILSGHNSLKTDEEMKIINKNVALQNILIKPKGIATNNIEESKVIDDLDILIGLSKYTHRKHLDEFRRFDIAYCMINDDINSEVYVADQIKTSCIRNFQLIFNKLNIKIMISLIENGSLTCIGKI